MTKVTSSNFASIVAKAAKSHGSTREILQTAVVFAIAQCNVVNAKTGKVNGNYTYANLLIGSKDFAGLSMRDLQIYVEAHADVKWERTTDGAKFVSQKTRGYKVEALSEKTWYEFSSTGEATVALRDTVLGSFIKRFEGIIKGDGKVTFAKSEIKRANADLTKLKAIRLAA